MSSEAPYEVWCDDYNGQAIWLPSDGVNPGEWVCQKCGKSSTTGVGFTLAGPSEIPEDYDMHENGREE